MQALMPLSRKVADRLKARGETLSVSESSAGGLISASLVACPGASVFYRGGAVIYAPNAFRGLLGLSRADLGDHRSASEPYARLLAQTLRQKCRTDWGLCETGASGPDGNGYGDPAGHVCLAVSGPDRDVSWTLQTGRSDRMENMHAFAGAGLELLLAQLNVS